MRTGILAMQGAFREHAEALRKCGCEAVEIRKPTELQFIDALIIPGGESTVIGKLLRDYRLMEIIIAKANSGMPIFGTCAGAILLAGKIEAERRWLGLMDIEVRRNAYGRQIDSFEVEVDIPVLGKEPFPAVFIRAPRIERVGPGVNVLARHKGGIVLVRQGNLLAATFHPELTGDLRLHRYFLEMFCGERKKVVSV